VIVTYVCASSAFGGAGFAQGVSIGAQVWKQTPGVPITIAWTGIITLVVLKPVDWTIGLRVDAEAETEGLDLAEHNERGYIL